MEKLKLFPKWTSFKPETTCNVPSCHRFGFLNFEQEMFLTLECLLRCLRLFLFIRRATCFFKRSAKLRKMTTWQNEVMLNYCDTGSNPIAVKALLTLPGGLFNFRNHKRGAYQRGGGRGGLISVNICS